MTHPITKGMSYLPLAYADFSDLSIGFEYEREERQTRDYPGSPAIFMVQEIWFHGVDLFQYLDQDTIDAIEQKASEEYEQQERDEEEAAAEACAERDREDRFFAPD